MTHGSLFSGIGGFDLAAQWMGWENIFHCEWNPFGQKVLKHHFPKSIGYNDITKTNFSIHRGTIDILTGGFPCQPYSTAGKRLGKEDDRHLWPEMLRAIREIQPCYVVGENVRGLTNWNGGVVFDEVQSDLENEGYEVLPFLLPACAVNAPHRRDRIWFIAHTDSRRNNRAETAESGIWKQQDKIKSGSRRAMQADRFSDEQPTSNPSSSRFKDSGNVREPKGQEFADRGNDKNVSLHPNSTGEQGKYVGQTRKGESDRPDSRNGISNWQNFPTQSPICRGNDGLPGELDAITFSKWRNESIKAYGNAIVPQMAFQIFKAIQQYDLK